MAALCRQFGISRQTGYKWLARYEAQGAGGLMERPPIAARLSHRIDDGLVAQILRLRKEHPSWGPKKLRAVLQAQQPSTRWPAPSTIGDLLKRLGCIRPRRRRLRVAPSPGSLWAGERPNDVWCVDFKGDFALGDGTRCYPLTITDHVTRYLLKCEALGSTRSEPVQREFEQVFREFGLPRRIRSDNGVPFATRAPGGLSAVAVYWIKLGIEPERIEPGQPQQNGRHERMHLTLGTETTRPPSPTPDGQQVRFAAFRREFNEVRPHEALGQKPPASVYVPSTRPHPAHLEPPTYGDEFQVRWTGNNGVFSWRGESVFVAKSLVREPVGLLQVSETRWLAYYGPLLLGALDDRDDRPRLRPAGNAPARLWNRADGAPVSCWVSGAAPAPRLPPVADLTPPGDFADFWLD